jgi:hypothetical protein
MSDGELKGNPRDGRYCPENKALSLAQILTMLQPLQQSRASRLPSNREVFHTG